CRPKRDNRSGISCGIRCSGLIRTGSALLSQLHLANGCDDDKSLTDRDVLVARKPLLYRSLSRKRARIDSNHERAFTWGFDAWAFSSRELLLTADLSGSAAPRRTTLAAEIRK